ncbi:flagellar protein FlgN [Dyella sp.]|jgi:flagella synthesis protein FlgN|uniref:flagella synthesis protein FlgN n=1 Tax=Dyella sp. TaxID=1869338 RepID=UPI002D77424F|nr:flagellar protein FlgN [Dyella sp.]HET6433638.1 flagellar protein FlgN [Dyella sp.]
MLQVELDSALSTVLDDMQRAVDSLSAVLADEREALLSADVTALDAAGSRKQALMQLLEQLDAERLQLSRSAPQTARELEPRWQALLQVLRGCREMNQHNGSVASQRLGSVRRALAVLTGQDADGGVYGRSGALQTRPRLQTLAEA